MRSATIIPFPGRPKPKSQVNAIIHARIKALFAEATPRKDFITSEQHLLARIERLERMAFSQQQSGGES